ncbi:hypothetical protein AAG747_03435 [Rapidithrix thailandica]|uniref:Uncharacterized protein n=1 Tax=Rapidithrix thailandica TaxID=413964 RepID=A0AAW9RPW2_9BACT
MSWTKDRTTGHFDNRSSGMPNTVNLRTKSVFNILANTVRQPSRYNAANNSI